MLSILPVWRINFIFILAIVILIIIPDNFEKECSLRWKCFVKRVKCEEVIDGRPT